MYAEAETPRPSHGRRFSRDAETHADPSITSPTQKLVETEHVAHLRQQISRLPEQQRRVLALYYYEELNLRQVGEVLQVSESRVSQIRSQALKRLRQELAGAGSTLTGKSWTESGIKRGPTLDRASAPFYFLCLPLVLFSVGVEVLLSLADSLLELPFDFLSLAFDLLAGISPWHHPQCRGLCPPPAWPHP